MMQFDANNIDERMFDYFEGNLNAQEMKELEHFVDQNPQYANDFEAWRMSFLEEKDKSYPLSPQLLAGSKGAIWMRWGLAVIGLIGLGTLAMSLLDFGQKDSDKIYTERSQLTAVESNNSVPPMLDLDVPAENYGSSNNGLDPASNVAAKSVDSDMHSGQKARSYGIYNEDTKGTRPLESVGEERNMLSSKAYSAPDDYVAEISPYRAGGYGYRKTVWSDAALAEAIDYFEDGGGNANSRNYDGTMDDHMEKQVTFGRYSKGFSYMLANLVERLQQPLGLENLHDPHFVVPEYFGPLAMNPSYAGSAGNPRMYASGRLQPSINGLNNYTGYLAFDGYISKWKMGVGLTAKYDQYENGNFQNWAIGAILSPKLKLNRKSTLEPSIQYTFGQTNMNLDELENGQSMFINRRIGVQFLALDNLAENSGNVSSINHDLKAGLLYNTESFYAGVTAHNLLQPTTFFSNDEFGNSTAQDIRITAQIGTDYQYRSDRDYMISPHIVLDHQAGYTEAWAGAYGKLDWFVLGGGLSTKLNYAATIGVEGKQFRLTYNYDRFRSDILSGGAHQVSLRLLFGKQKGDDGILKVGLGQ